RNPERAVEDCKLRKDLFYRLKVFPIPMPTLQERGDDVKLLAIHFLGEVCRSAGLVKEIDDAALDALTTYHWPGNVRELRNAVERAFILARDVISPDCLPAECRRSQVGPRIELQARVGTSLDDVIRSHTLATLEHFNGNKKRTAEALGISLKTLYNRLKSYDSKETKEDR
ncbi:MAG: helix-turn-helix domain-containing protein, partial [Candidatus Sulfomarinibacteraceae bacterium]